MATEYEIPRPTRRCKASGQEMRAGDEYVSAMVETPVGLERWDYLSSQWQGPPPEAVGYWRGKLAADPPVRRPKTASVDDMLNLFDQLELAQDPRSLRLRYVLALLLIRRKAFKFLGVESEEGSEFLVVKRSKTGDAFRILDPRLAEDQAQHVEAELARMLDADGTV